MNLIFRVILLLACVRFALQALVGYAFDFREFGYPLWPLMGLGVCFAAYVKLRPSPPRHHPNAVPPAADESMVDHALLFLVLAMVTSAFLLDKRGESPFTPFYFLHLSTLTFFQLLLPYVLAFGLKKARSLVTLITMLILMALLVDGTMKDPQPIKQFLAETGAFDSRENSLLELPKPILITPPGHVPAAPATSSPKALPLSR